MRRLKASNFIFNPKMNENINVVWSLSLKMNWFAFPSIYSTVPLTLEEIYLKSEKKLILRRVFKLSTPC